MAKKSLHEERGITFQEFGALLGTRNMLATGMLVQEFQAGEDNPVHAPNCHLFNMEKTGYVNASCGSVGCIGGTMAMIMGLKEDGDIRAYVAHRRINRPYERDAREMGKLVRSPALAPLFFPPEGTEAWELITPTMAVQAIDNFLNTGKPRWGKILSDADAGLY